jgi:solute carrier family 25 phosphate transporter 3
VSPCISVVQLCELTLLMIVSCLALSREDLFEGSLKFGIYEVLKPAVKKILVTASSTSVHLTFVNSQILAFVISGFVSGLVASAVLCPMEALRIRLVSESDFAPKGWIQGGYKMLSQEGILSLWKGMLPMVYKQVPYTVTKNVSFDLITRYSYLILISQGIVMTSGVKMTIPFLSAVLASILSCISSQPGDMLLSLVNAHQGDRRTNDFVKEILRSKRGVRGFFVGINTRFLHVGITVTLQLFIYDFVKRLCGIAATGTV